MPRHAFLDRLTANRFVRFAFAGGVATIAQYTMLAVLVEAANIEPLIAAILAYACGASTSYIINRKLAFAESTVGFASGLARYAAVMAIGLALNTAIFAALQMAGLHYLLAQGGATAMVLGWNYFGSKRFVFR